jgi:hypothetical protein
VQQVTKGDFDVNDLVGFTSNSIIVSRGDMNHASEIFSFEEKYLETNYQCKYSDLRFTGFKQN